MGNLLESPQSIDRSALRAKIKESYLGNFYYKLNGQTEMHFDNINRRMDGRHIIHLNDEIDSVRRSISNTCDQYQLERLAFQRDSMTNWVRLTMYVNTEGSADQQLHADTYFEIAKYIDETLDMILVGTDENLQKTISRCEHLVNGKESIVSDDDPEYQLNMELVWNIMAYFDIESPTIDTGKIGIGIAGIARASEIACYFGSSHVLKAIFMRSNLAVAKNLTKLLRFVCSGFTAQKSKNDKECIDLLLGKCNREIIRQPDEHNFSAIFYLRDRPDTVFRLLNKGAYIGAQYKEALPVASYVHPNWLKDHLDACIHRENGPTDDRVTQKQYKSVGNPIKYNLINFFSSERNEMAAIKFIATVDEYQHLLTHPLIELAVSLKWKRVSSIFYSMLVLYVAFAVSALCVFYEYRWHGRESGRVSVVLRTITMILNVFHLLSQGCLHLLHQRMVMSFCCTIFYSLSFVIVLSFYPASTITKFLIPTYWIMFGTIITIFSLVRVLSLLNSNNQRIAHLLHHFQNLIKWKIKSMIFVTVSIPVIDIDVELTSTDYVICISLITFELFNMAGSISWTFSKYYVMFRDVAWSSIKSLQLCVVLIPAFAMMFSILLDKVPIIEVDEDSDLQSIRPAFNEESNYTSFISSVRNAFVMATGEFNYNEIESQLDQHVTGQYVFLAFLWFISVTFMNLMNGLAVGDTQRISATAELVSFRQRIHLLFSYEELYMSAIDKIIWFENNIHALRSTTHHLVNTWAYLKIDNDICQIQWILKYRVKRTNSTLINVEIAVGEGEIIAKTFNFTCYRKLYDRTVLLVKNRNQHSENNKQAEVKQKRKEDRLSNMESCLKELQLSSQKSESVNEIRFNKIESSLQEITDLLKQFYDVTNKSDAIQSTNL